MQRRDYDDRAVLVGSERWIRDSIFQRGCSPLCDKVGFKRNGWRFWGNVHVINLGRLSAKERIGIRGGRRRRRSLVFNTGAR